MSFMKCKLIVGKIKNEQNDVSFLGGHLMLHGAAFEMGSCNNPGSSSA